jgi:hypothetical protein
VLHKQFNDWIEFDLEGRGREVGWGGLTFCFAFSHTNEINMKLFYLSFVG